MKLPRLWTADQVAAAFNWTRQHVYYLIRMGKLLACKVGRKWRVIPTWQLS